MSASAQGVVHWGRGPGGVRHPGAGVTLMRETKESARESLRSVLRNPNLRRIQLAFGGSLVGDWAYGTAILVWAFQESGATGVGLFTAARFVGAAFAGPVGAAVADRMSRRTFMMATDLIRACLASHHRGRDHGRRTRGGGVRRRRGDGHGRRALPVGPGRVDPAARRHPG